MMYSTNSSLTTIVPQLSKLLLLLGSNHDGEVVAAAHAIEKVLRSAGCDWHDLAKGLRLSATPSDARSDWRTQLNKHHDERSTISWCYHRRHVLFARDRRFIENVANQHKPFSPNQHSWLRDIAARLRSEA
jgi:hypothetical protein